MLDSRQAEEQWDEEKVEGAVCGRRSDGGEEVEASLTENPNSARFPHDALHNLLHACPSK
jgi:hypothetical protein